MHTILCLQKTITTGGSHYPIFVGFSTAAELAKIAEAPAFTQHTPHADICANILTPPVKDWQRPISSRRVGQIASVYDQPGELMPNPVLLCENTTLGRGAITIRQQMNLSVPTDVWEVIITPSPGGAGRPLWILDGQHRIGGLAGSKQHASPLPVVLLLNQGPAAYSGPALAKIFAQVTTEATALDDLHQEWLTFAFGLKAYDESSLPTARYARKAMVAVAELCRKPTVGAASVTNPFFNQVKFNDHDAPSGPPPGGFKYTCIELKDLFLDRYYNATAQIGYHLDPLDLIAEFVAAFHALVASVSSPQQESVFFGQAQKHEQRIMQDAFIAAVLAAILERGAGQNWKDLLRDLQFPGTAWNFSNWTRTLNGSVGAWSRKLAIEVLSTAFRKTTLPTAQGNLADYFQGNEAEIELAFSRLTPSGNPTAVGRDSMKLVGGNTLSKQIAPARHVKIARKSTNIAKLELVDLDSPPTNPRHLPAGGFILDSPQDRKPLKLSVRMHLYGGTEKEARITISW
jgi:hypothetical protein